jgi:CheY-like chemotaxis protein
MEPINLKDKRKSPRVPVEIMVLGQLEDRHISMWSENISREGMFLHCREFLRPRVVFLARIWLSTEEEPLQAYLTSCFVERTATAYGIGVSISGINAADRAIWESFYGCCVDAQAEQKQRRLASEQTLRNLRIVVVDGSVNLLVEEELGKQGICVLHCPSATAALAQIREEPIAAVVSDLRRPGLEELALCHGISALRLPTRTVLLTEGAAPEEFLLALNAGATRVIAKPCSNDLLVSRIVDALHPYVPNGGLVSGASRREGQRVGGERMIAPEQALIVGNHSWNSIESAARRASEYLGQACRFVSTRLVGRANA